VVGFSWGGAVGAEMVARGLVPQIPTLLLAPTTAWIATLSVLSPYRRDAALRLVDMVKGEDAKPTSDSGSPLTPLATEDASTPSSTSSLDVQVVHAHGDTAFCPHPERWQLPSNNTSTSSHSERPPIQLTMVEDNHVLFHPQSQREITAIYDEYDASGDQFLKLTIESELCI